MIKIVIPLNPVTKKNSLRVVQTTYGKPRVLPSEQFERYEKAALKLLPKRRTIDYPVNVRALFYMATRRKVDLTNLLEALDDVLVKGGIIADDNSRLIVSHDGSRVLCDKSNPRTEVTIVNACFVCDCWSEDTGCTMEPFHRACACPIEADEDTITAALEAFRKSPDVWQNGGKRGAGMWIMNQSEAEAYNSDFFDHFLC